MIVAGSESDEFSTVLLNADFYRCVIYISQSNGFARDMKWVSGVEGGQVA